ncbi:MAG: DUF1569 domain-containing protein [Planctomycetota bacterium]
MSSMFNPKDSDAILARIQRLTPNQKAEWGKMNVSQMLAHCRAPLRVATGELQLKRSLMGFLFGRLAKKSLTGPKPFQRNLPTDKSFLVRDQRDFATEKRELIEQVQSFVAGGPAGLISTPHPFFGKLTVAEWDTLQWKHLDHHLRQFGV